MGRQLPLISELKRKEQISRDNKTLQFRWDPCQLFGRPLIGLQERQLQTLEMHSFLYHKNQEQICFTE